MSKWTNADLKRLGVITEQKKLLGIPKRDPKALAEMKAFLVLIGVSFTTEFKFHPLRKWRFDIALIDRKIAIEYEGTNSAKSRHTTLTGYAKDCEKYNQAQILGWKVMRYTAINAGEFKKDLADLI